MTDMGHCAGFMVVLDYGDPNSGTLASWQVLYLLNHLPNSCNPILIKYENANFFPK